MRFRQPEGPSPKDVAAALLTPVEPGAPLIVRLRNWVGDVTLGVVALRRLAQAGYALQLVGKGWAGRLLAGEGWPIHVLPKNRSDRIQLFRDLRDEARRTDPGFDRRLNTLVLPTSFSSALETRLAGLRSLGYAHEARSLLLKRAIRKLPDLHEMAHDWRLVQALLGMDEPVPAHASLTTSSAAHERLLALLATHGVQGPFVVLCPFAGGTFEKIDKRWPHFPELAAVASAQWGLPLLLCPGPGEGEAARRDYPQAMVLDGVGLDEYAVLLSLCALMVSNDTGPGHLAAAVGAPLLSILGPTDARRWGARGPGVRILQLAPGKPAGRGADPAHGAWPTVEQVICAGREMLACAGIPGDVTASHAPTTRGR